jgi:EAL domain-containing protein (putative c-di-GMP-specific phosphodiesterase class I)
MIAPTPEHQIINLDARELGCRMVAQHICRPDRPQLDRWVEFLVRPDSPWNQLEPLEFVELGYRERGLLFDQDILRRSIGVATRFPETTWFSVNIHPSSLHRERFVHFVRNQLDHHGVDPGRLIFELVEFGGPVNLMASRTVIEELRSDGIRFALDDFGPGFSNLDLLGAQLVDFVKLDRSLVRFIDSLSGYRNLIEGLQAMAQRTGVQLVAEGVETRQQAAMLAEMGIEWVQGFVFSRPAEIE